MSGPMAEVARIYRLSPHRRLALGVVWAVLTLPLVVGGLAFNDAAATLIGSVVGAILGTVFAAAGWLYPRLVLDASGIQLQQLGYTLSAKWEDVIGLRRERGTEGLILGRPLEGRGAALSAYLATSRFLTAIEIREFVAARRYIPIESFAYWLRHGDLENEIVRYVPHLRSIANGRAAADVPDRLN